MCLTEPHKKAPELIRREEVRERHAQVTLVSVGRKSKAWQASLEFASVNNFSGVWDSETVPSFLVPDLGITKEWNYCPKYEGPTEEMEALWVLGSASSAYESYTQLVILLLSLEIFYPWED